MKARITNKNTTGKILQNRKERHFLEEYAVIVNSKDYDGGPSLESVIILRVYGTKAMNYACLWINDRVKNIHVSGGGNAGGYGYHRPSQAAANALTDAGINISEDIGGRGDKMIERALKSVANAMGYRKVLIHKAHA